MPRPLDVCVAKIGRAEEQQRALDSDFLVWLNEAMIEEKAITFFRQRDPDSGYFHFVVETLPDTPRFRWGLMLGEIVHSLRSALDALAYALADLDSPGRGDDHVTQFPIYLLGTKRFWKDDLIRRQIQHIALPHRQMIERVQPYQTSKPARDNALALLQRLSNTDKHRGIHVTLLAFDPRSFLDPDFLDLTNASATHTALGGPFKVGAKVVTVGIERIDPNGPEPEVKMKTSFMSPHIALEDGAPLKYVIPNLSNAVKRVFAEFAPLFK
jgi:hypothetical protein